MVHLFHEKVKNWSEIRELICQIGITVSWESQLFSQNKLSQEVGIREWWTPWVGDEVVVVVWVRGWQGGQGGCGGQARGRGGPATTSLVRVQAHLVFIGCSANKMIRGQLTSRVFVSWRLSLSLLMTLRLALFSSFNSSISLFSSVIWLSRSAIT